MWTSCGFRWNTCTCNGRQKFWHLHIVLYLLRDLFHTILLNTVGDFLKKSNYLNGEILSLDIWWIAWFNFSSAVISGSHSSWLLCVWDPQKEAKEEFKNENIVVNSMKRLQKYLPLHTLSTFQEYKYFFIWIEMCVNLF